MPYNVTVTPAPERAAVIDDKCKKPLRTQVFYHFQNTQTSLPVIRLEIGIPIYRMENYRTQVAQMTHIRKYGRPSTFFQQENLSAQLEQHKILLELAREGKGSTVVPIMNALEEEPQQTEPLLISRGGVVVNGNRRLAAMRELYASGDSQYATFSHVDCMVLPPNATPKEIKEVEVRLQMQLQTLLPYDWMNEALAIRDLLTNHGLNRRQVAELLRMKESDIDIKLMALAEAELYLDDGIGKKQEYERVKKSEELFKDMSKAFKNKVPEDLEASRAIAWFLAEHGSQMGQRVYAYNMAFGEKSREVLDQLAQRLDVDLSDTPAQTEAAPDDSDFEVDIDLDDGASDGRANTTTYDPVLRVLRDSDRSDEVVEVLKEVCDTIIDQGRDEQRGQLALKHVQKGCAELAEVDLTQANPRTLQAIRNNLATIREIVARLETQLASTSQFAGVGEQQG